MYEDRYFIMTDEMDVNFGQCYRLYREEKDFLELHSELKREDTEWIDKKKVCEISEEDYEFYLIHHEDLLEIQSFAKRFSLSKQAI